MFGFRARKSRAKNSLSMPSNDNDKKEKIRQLSTERKRRQRAKERNEAAFVTPSGISRKSSSLTSFEHSNSKSGRVTPQIDNAGVFVTPTSLPRKSSSLTSFEDSGKRALVTPLESQSSSSPSVQTDDEGFASQESSGGEKILQDGLNLIGSEFQDLAVPLSTLEKVDSCADSCQSVSNVDNSENIDYFAESLNMKDTRQRVSELRKKGLPKDPMCRCKVVNHLWVKM